MVTKHLEGMKQTIEKIDVETAQQRNANLVVEQHLQSLRSALVEAFSDLLLPGTGEVATGDNIDTYMTKLYSIILDSPQENEGLISNVREIISRLAFQR